MVRKSRPCPQENSSTCASARSAGREMEKCVDQTGTSTDGRTSTCLVKMRGAAWTTVSTLQTLVKRTATVTALAMPAMTTQTTMESRTLLTTARLSQTRTNLTQIQTART